MTQELKEIIKKELQEENNKRNNLLRLFESWIEVVNVEQLDKLEKSKYESALFVQVTDDELLFKDTKKYQNFINVLLKRNNYKHLKCICFNPNDELDIDGFNVRSHSPYFLINIANKKILSKSHKNLLKTKYFDNMNEKYLNYLNPKRKNK